MISTTRLGLCALALVLSAPAATVLVLKTDGTTVEGETTRKKIAVNGRDVAVEKIASIHNAAPLSAAEEQRAQSGFAAILGTDRAARDKAVADVTTLGIAAITPLLKTFKDTDQHEPNPLYRLFTRLAPPRADGLDRSLSVFRMTDGSVARAKFEDGDWTVNGTAIPAAQIRRVAVKQKSVRRAVEVHALRHCNQIEFLDTGVILTAGSNVDASATGFVRLSWNADDWTSDPDGLKKPAGNYKTHLVNGHPFGALVGRVGAAGEMFAMGRQYRKSGMAGELHLAINDNRHWQNNLGSFRVTLSATDAYDAGDAY